MIFLTNKQRITAISWKEARIKAKKLNLVILGLWIADVDCKTGKLKIDYNNN